MFESAHHLEEQPLHRNDLAARVSERLNRNIPVVVVHAGNRVDHEHHSVAILKQIERGLVYAHLSFNSVQNHSVDLVERSEVSFDLWSQH